MKKNILSRNIEKYWKIYPERKKQNLPEIDLEFARRKNANKMNKFLLNKIMIYEIWLFSSLHYRIGRFVSGTYKILEGKREGRRGRNNKKQSRRTFFFWWPQISHLNCKTKKTFSLMGKEFCCPEECWEERNMPGENTEGRFFVLAFVVFFKLLALIWFCFCFLLCFILFCLVKKSRLFFVVVVLFLFMFLTCWERVQKGKLYEVWEYGELFF